MRIKPLIAIVAAGAALAATPVTAGATEECAGAVATGCTYCSQYGGAESQDRSNCDTGTFGYAWRRCEVWVKGRCDDSTLPVVTGPPGRKCGFNSTTDVTREAGWQTGDINAGPLVTAAAGTLVCTIHVNNSTHSGSVVVTESVRATGDAVAVMAPRALNYPATAADDVVLCTRWVPDSGPALYWVPAPPTTLGLVQGGYWSTDPNSACGFAFGGPPDDPECRIWLSVDRFAGTNVAEIWQDCESYEPII